MTARALESVLALAQGGPDERVFDASVEGWLASPAQGITASIDPVTGTEATVAALRDLAPSTVTVAAAVTTATVSWAEVSRRVDDAQETCVVGLRHDPRGIVTRLVWLRAPAVPAARVDAHAEVADARPVFERYSGALVASDFPAASACFTADTIYSHPPYGGRPERALFLGRDALLHGLIHERGTNPVRQVVSGFWQAGSRVFVEGVVEGIPNGGTFITTAELSGVGEIARLVAFYSSRRIP
jgi:hypothetical protein